MTTPAKTKAPQNLPAGVTFSSGKIVKPVFIVAYGPDGAGKTSFGAEAPNPIFVGPEAGSSELETERFHGLDTWERIREVTRWLRNNQHDFKTYVGDTLDWMEPLLHKFTCAQDKKGMPSTIEESHGGYGKGFTFANNHWREWLEDLMWLREHKKMNIILLAHAQSKVFNDPTEQLPYDRWMLKLNDKASAIFREAADAVLFFKPETLVRADPNNKRKAKAVGKENRIHIYATRTSAFDAKNRYGLPSEWEYTLGAGWSEFMRLRLAGKPDSMTMVMDDIERLIPLVPEERQQAMREAVEKQKGDLNGLIEIRNYARTLAGDE